MSKKAFFIDLDGTLLNDQREITQGNRSAIAKALSEGHMIIITTGRPLVSALQQAQSLGLTLPGCYLISFNGGILYDTGANRVISKTTIPLPLVKKVFAEANRLNIHIQTYDDHYILVEPRCNNHYLELYCQKTGMSSRVISDINLLTEEPVKMLLIDYDEPKSLAVLQEWISENLSDSMDSFFSCREYVEVVPAGLNKGNAVLKLAEVLGIPYEDTIAIGDEENDRTMIEKAHTGVCMCNGSDAIKEIADYVTLHDNNHDGIAEVIEKYTGITL